MPKLTEQIVVFVPAMPTIAAQAKRIAELETEVARLRDLLIEDGHESWCRTNTADALHEDASCNCHLSTLGGAA